jgi:phosphomannomutase
MVKHSNFQWHIINNWASITSIVKISISGIRGVFGGEDLSLYEIVKYSRLFAQTLVGRGEKCILGRDTRPSSSVIAETVMASLMLEGVEVFDLNIAPTPMVFRESRKHRGGCIVTASHNPLEWNGLKLVLNGRGIFENELHDMLNYEQTNKEKATHYGGSFQTFSNYVDDVVKIIRASGDQTRNVKVGLDPGGGATCGFVSKLFKNLGHRFYSINDTYGISSRTPDPTVDSLGDLSVLVVNNRLDFGFAFDLDGDRLVVVDKNGKKLTPDTTLLLCVASALNLGMKKFVTSIDTSLSIEKFARRYGPASVRFALSKVGESNVVSKMLEFEADAGGEGSSAGFIMPKFNMCRDGFLASAIISSLDNEMVEECIEFGNQYSQIRTKLAVHSDLHSEIITKLTDTFGKDCSETLTLDGIKAILDEDSWALVRPSNTEHAIRVSVESRDSKVQELHNKIINKVQSIYEQIK